MIIAGGCLLFALILNAFIVSFIPASYGNRKPIDMSLTEHAIANGTASFGKKITFFIVNVILGFFSPKNFIVATIFVALVYGIGYLIVGDLNWVI